MCRTVVEQCHFPRGSPLDDGMHSLDGLDRLFWEEADGELNWSAAPADQRSKVAASAGIATTQAQPEPGCSTLTYGRLRGEQLLCASVSSQQRQHVAAAAARAGRQMLLPSEQHALWHAPADQQQCTGGTEQRPRVQISERLASGGSSQCQAEAAGAACPRGMGRWCGVVAVIDSRQHGSQDSDAGIEAALQCDEALVSMDTAPANHPPRQQQQLQQHATPAWAAAGAACPSSCHPAAAADCCVPGASASESGGFEPAEAGAALQQQQQPEEAAAASAALLRALDRAACARSGRCVLTASAEEAEACGAASVRPRLLVAEVSVYMHSAACSRLALEQANSVVASINLPDGATYMPVSADSLLFTAAAAWQFPAFAVCLGSSYMQRILERLPQLADAALACPGFEDYCRCLNHRPLALPPRLSEQDATACLATLHWVLFTCVFLALKVADQVHAMGLLRFMLSSLSSGGVVVSLAEAANVEARCLEALDWRLGPFFADDELPGNDEALWAAGMAHWGYGSDADTAGSL